MSLKDHFCSLCENLSERVPWEPVASEAERGRTEGNGALTVRLGELGVRREGSGRAGEGGCSGQSERTHGGGVGSNNGPMGRSQALECGATERGPGDDGLPPVLSLLAAQQGTTCPPPPVTD